MIPRRRRQIARAEQRSGKALTDEEKAKIEPISEGSEFISSLFPVLSVVFLVRSFIFEPFQNSIWINGSDLARRGFPRREQIYLWH